MKKQIQKTTVAGFTLIEVLISLLIFSVVITMAVGALFSMVDAGEQSRSVNSVMENLDVALETMAETVRSGTGYAGYTNLNGTQTTCGNPSSALYFTIPSTSSYLNAGLTGKTVSDIMYGLQNGQIFEKIDYSDGTNTITPITAAEVHVQNLVFWVNNCTAVAPAEPYVFMAVQGFAETRQSNKASFNVQTPMTAR